MGGDKKKKGEDFNPVTAISTVVPWR